jgi:phage terminase large subunit
VRINKAYKPLIDSNKVYKVLKGGAGSGKSYSITQIEILKAIESKQRTLWVRKVANTLRNSIFQLIRDVLSDTPLEKNKDYWVNKSEMSFEFSNGSTFILSGLDDVEKLKSIAGITRIVIEEATELEEGDFNQLDLRLRGKDLKNPSITLMFNPISANHWLCKRFFTQVNESNTLVLQTTYKDNSYLDESYKQRMEALINIDENLYRIYVLGEWGVEDPDKLFAKDYKRHIHFGKSYQELFNPNLEIYLAWDFNIQNTCLAIQSTGDEINVLKEYHFKGYDLQMLCELIKQDFPSSIFIINGDASGRGGSALTTGNISAYQLLRTYLGLSDLQFHVPKSNPSHINSRLLSNLILKNWKVNVSNECIELDKDLSAVEVDVNGSLDPYKKKHPERSHWLDPLRYHFNTEHYDKLKLININ